MLTEVQVRNRIRQGKVLSEAEALTVLEKEVRERGEPGPILRKTSLPSPLASLFQNTFTHCGVRTLEFKVRHWHSAIGYHWVGWFVCPVCGLTVADDGPADECT